MNQESWHSEFNPKRFLQRVCVDNLLERNARFNEQIETGEKKACFICVETGSTGIFLNDRSFLCMSCFQGVEKTKYPEKYEARHRSHLAQVEARQLAWNELRQEFEHKIEDSPYTLWAWGSLLLVLLCPPFLIASVALFLLDHQHGLKQSQKAELWNKREIEWKESNPEPSAPSLRHFHDPRAELSARDRKVLHVFDHWPGYPPYWDYLRTVVLTRDGDRCQVTGCPSRLSLHVHHRSPVAEGGKHAPANLVTLCEFHHALEPDKGHERIWGTIKTSFFTLIPSHERANSTSEGSHTVTAHLRRLELAKASELEKIVHHYGMQCPQCKSGTLELSRKGQQRKLHVSCRDCNSSTEEQLLLAEETGPRLAEILNITKNRGSWNPRWDMLSERTESKWRVASKSKTAVSRAKKKKTIERKASSPPCPICDAPTRLIRPTKGKKWKPFWGCTRYPTTRCRGSVRFKP